MAFPIRIDRTSPRSAAIQIAEGIVVAIRNGKLKRGERLPSTRIVAQAEGVSLMTVWRAYKDLCGRGVLEQEGDSGVLGVRVTCNAVALIESQRNERLNAQIALLADTAKELGVSHDVLVRHVNAVLPRLAPVGVSSVVDGADAPA